MLLDVAAARPDETAVDDLVRRRSWAELVDRSTRVGRWLRHVVGLGPGDHAAMVMGNRAEFLELAYGALLSGTWLTPANWHLTAEELAYVIADCGARVVVADPAFAATVTEAAAAAGDVRVVVAGAELDAELAAASDAPFPVDGPAGGNMFYTSGTTGRPKGVKRSVKSSVGDQLSALAASGRLLGLDGGGPHLVTGPLYHAAPLGFAVMDQGNGAPMVVMPRFEEAATLSLIEHHRVRNTHLVPTMFVRLLRLPDDARYGFDPSSLHTVLHGAAPVSVAVKQRMIEWWGEVLVEYWGASEGGVVTLVDSAEWHSRPGTVGRAIATHEVFAADPDGARLPPGENGTLWCRNLLVDEVFRYHNDDEKTAAAFLAPGTYTLGDIGRVDEDGYVFLADRASNMIISGGVNIYPAEIEQVLIEHPAVADVAVFGIPDDEWGESVKAAVELVDGNEPTPELERDILAFARERLAGYKVPRSIDVEEQLPRQPSGKLFVRVLRDRYWSGRDRRI
ncbi:MAG: AMP-binding protein [Acidimicrobiales bacterium]